jgi:pimeloyl-ACP methyl ester carboxylesterase
VDHRLAFVDLRGFGGSLNVAGPYDFVGPRDKLEEFRTCVLDGTASVLVGHSCGALLALCAASRWPSVRGVVAFNLPAFRTDRPS